MFLRHNDHPAYADLSTELRDPSDWKIGSLREFEFPLDITAVAYDPVSLFLAIGTSGGAIYLHGGPGVESKLLLPDPLSVRFLQFGLLTERLVCLDEGHHLHVWDLSPLGCPKYMARIRWDPTTFMILSPSHNHIFLAMRNGELKTYDLACMCKSPYTVPNMWRLYEEQVLKSGIPLTPSPSSGHQPVELVVHPRDLNLLFVAYEDGVLLLDLRERSIACSFELILPPGAPGGAGYNSEDILTHRRSLVTSIAIHPSAHFFAMGHTDGSISFWAIENPDEPILVRTLDELDVNVVDANELEAHLHSTAAKPVGNSLSREPIFKLSWSGLSNSTDPRGGETILTVLGGLKAENTFGLTVLLLPPFNPGEPPATSPVSQHGLHPFMATAMRQSLDPKNSFFYATNAPVQDFYLTPRHSPHFNNTYDPYSILMLVEAGQVARMIEPREFPPPSFVSPEMKSIPPRSQEAEQPHNDLDDLNATLQSLLSDASPQYIGLPFASFGGSSVLPGCYWMHTVSKDMYSEFLKTDEPQKGRLRIQLRGGAAYIEPSHEAKSTKYQPHRVLVTSSRNLTVNFYDISGQLLQGSGGTPLEHWFPEPLDSFEIDLRNVLDIIDEERRSGEPSDLTRSISATHLAIETLECAIALNTGELVIYHRNSNHMTQGFNDLRDKELTSLEHAKSEPWRRLLPYFMFRAPERGSILTSAISEIGFLATSLTDGSLFIIDMRGPTVLHRSSDSPTKQQPRYSLSIRHSDSNHQNNGITSLTWTVSGIDNDSKARIRLIAIRTSGEMEIYTIVRSDSGFNLEGPAAHSKAIADPLPNGTFVITSKTGTLCKADGGRFAATLHSNNQVSEPVILITTGVKGVKGFLNLNGEQIGKADWGSKHGDVVSVQIVERMGSRSLVVYTNRSSLLVYSLPHLEHMHTVPALPAPLRSISIDESGDFIAFDAHPTSGSPRSAIYGTLFNFRRAYELPVIDLVSKKGTIPAQPQPVSMGPASLLGSWFNFSQTVSGQQIDELLGGSDRPAPVRLARDTFQKQEEDTNPTSGSASANSQSNLYSRLASALSERGQMLGDLEENFKALEEGSKSMVTQAKRLAAQNTAKSWFGL